MVPICVVEEDILQDLMCSKKPEIQLKILQALTVPAGGFIFAGWPLKICEMQRMAPARKFKLPACLKTKDSS
jgi:hypothetical protein